MTTPADRAEALSITSEAFGELDVALAEIERLQAIIAEGEGGGGGGGGDGEKCFVGACPSTNGSMKDVPAKWGSPVGLRSFSGGGLAAVGRPEGVDHQHHSWKPPLGQQVTKAQITAAFTNMVEGDVATVWHESDVKFRNGSFTSNQAEQAVAVSNQFHNLVSEMREAGDIPWIWTADVYAAWMFMSNSGLFPGTATDKRTATYWLTKHNSDLIGIDADAISNKTKYPDFTSARTNVVNSIPKYERRGWCIPEWMHYRIDGDSSGEQRADWFDSCGRMFMDTVPRPKNLLLFDTEWEDRVQSVKPGTPEFPVIEDLIVYGRQS